MAESMIEGVARALVPWPSNPDDLVFATSAVQYIGGQPVCFANQSTPVPLWKLFERDACKAVHAMREPTEEMTMAGNEFDCSPLASDVWKTMIDAALKTTAVTKG